MFTVIDNFLSPRAWDQLQEARHTVAFADIRNDIDGVTYPEIATEIPDIVLKEIEFLAAKPPNKVFMRRSPTGVPVPNIVHTDNSHGQTSLMLYLQDKPDLAGYRMDIAGTAFLRHRLLGIAYAPTVNEFVGLCVKSANSIEHWHVHSRCEMKANRACIFEAGWFHCAEPVGGFGEGVSARTVLTAFFD